MAKEIGNRARVGSRMIRSVGYDEPSEVLEIQFSNGAIYQYADVPKDVHRSLMNAESVGKYFHANVKDSYDEQKL